MISELAQVAAVPHLSLSACRAQPGPGLLGAVSNFSVQRPLLTAGVPQVPQLCPDECTGGGVIHFVKCIPRLCEFLPECFLCFVVHDDAPNGGSHAGYPLRQPCAVRMVSRTGQLLSGFSDGRQSHPNLSRVFANNTDLSL